MPTGDIMVVEDEVKIRSILADYLVKAGFTVSTLERGDEVIPRVRRDPPRLILLDVMLPGMDGLEVCRELRKFSSIPVIMITARVDEIDRLLGLELGADDYICKPFSPREVVARVRAVLRRAVTHSDAPTLESGEIRLVDETRQVFAAGREVRLTPIEYNLLKALVARPERVFSRTELTALVQGYDFEGYDRTIDSHVKNLRKKLALHLPGKDVIGTVYGLGYRFNPGGAGSDPD